jgi:hypothetical protein
MLIFHVWSEQVDRKELARFDTQAACELERDTERKRIPSREFICSKENPTIRGK